MIELSHKRIGLAAILVLAAGIFPVQAQEAEKEADEEAESAQVEPAGDTAVAEKRQKVTGSRISRTVSDDGRVDTFAPVDVYSREEFRRTGEIDLERALRRLDPSIRGGF